MNKIWRDLRGNYDLVGVSKRQRSMKDLIHKMPKGVPAFRRLVVVSESFDVESQGVMSPSKRFERGLEQE